MKTLTRILMVFLIIAGLTILVTGTVSAQDDGLGGGGAPAALTEKAVEVIGSATPAAADATATAVAADAGDTELIEVAVTPSDGNIPGATTTPSAKGTNLISITLDDVEMVDVVRMFTTISGANILSTPTNLRGRVTVNLSDVEWKPALESILDMHNLNLKETRPGSEVYSIVPRVPGAPEPLAVETLFLRYAKVDSVQPVLKSMLAAGGTVSPFPSRNALVVRTTKANLDEMQQVIDKIDKLRDQVFIEAKFLELDDTAIKDLGVNWQVLQGYNIGVGNLNWSLNQNRQWNESNDKTSSQWDKRSNVDAVNNRYDIDNQPYEESTTTWAEEPPDSGNWVQNTVLTPTRTVTDTIDKGRNVQHDVTDKFSKNITDIRTAVLGVDDFRILLSALKQMNGITVVSNPKIIVANEEPAIIHIGRTEKPFEATVTPATQTSGAFTTYRAGAAVDFGVKLTVTPTVNTSSNITVRIEPELTRLLGYDTAPDGSTKYPIIASKTIKTMFCLENGKTVAIGGLTETRDQEVVTKVPLLGDIPIIGKYLFSHTHQEKRQQETIIFVTVGLAIPESMRKSDGYPEDTELVHKQILRSQLQQQKVKEEVETIQKAVDKDDKKTKARLLRRRS